MSFFVRLHFPQCPKTTICSKLYIARNQSIQKQKSKGEVFSEKNMSAVREKHLSGHFLIPSVTESQSGGNYCGHCGTELRQLSPHKWRDTNVNPVFQNPLVMPRANHSASNSPVMSQSYLGRNSVEPAKLARPLSVQTERKTPLNGSEQVIGSLPISKLVHQPVHKPQKKEHDISKSVRTSRAEKPASQQLKNSNENKCLTLLQQRKPLIIYMICGKSINCYNLYKIMLDTGSGQF